MADTENESADDFNFDAWASDINLNRKVTQILRQEDLCTKDSLKLVSEHELRSIGVQLGSAKLICKEVLKWTDKQETSAPPSNSNR
ncbi:hypothetical protein DPMN_045845 [Dreissena polymorpha]|uniref:SAM domain-containing protein n=1 Tax=Dreissena polymorpha TaxID=45954 RepID=A0A9D4D537_DREPO|nr:hypothetical protein DPMN_045845 [Dreissena polymorpha]